MKILWYIFIRFTRNEKILIIIDWYLYTTEECAKPMLLLINQGLMICFSKVYAESCQISKMELIAKIVNGIQPLAIFVKKLYLRV